MKRLLTFLFALCTITMVWAENVTLTSSTTTWEDGKTYVLNSNVTISSRITISGNVHLVLGAGYTLTASEGILLGTPNSLTIDGEGTLIATGKGDNPGIGAYQFGTLVINSGTINASANSYGAGIGGTKHNLASDGSLTINGGVVNATGGSNGGAGIGGGYNDWAGNKYGVADAIVINGGQVTATAGDSYAAGIGKGRSGGNTYGSVTLGWTNPTDFINVSSYNLGSIAFASGKQFVLDGTETLATTSNIGGKKIVPYNPFVTGYCGDPSFNDGQDVTYTYYTLTHTLIISGTGEMGSYNPYPWDSYKNELTTVVIENGVTNVAEDAFEYYSHLTSVTLGNTITSIGVDAFYGTRITEITLPASVTSIGEYAFQSNNNLTTVRLLGTTPPSLNSEAFDYYYVEHIIVPAGTANTYAMASGWSEYSNVIEDTNGNRPTAGICGSNLTWSYDTSTHTLTISGTGGINNYFDYGHFPWERFDDELTTVVIGDGVTYIPERAFQSYYYLTTIRLLGSTPPSLHSEALDSYPYGGYLEHIIVPVGSVDAYALAPVWSDYAEIIEDTNGNHYHPTSGTCGSNLTWNYDTTTHTLTVSGSGYMNDYYYVDEVPWHCYANELTTVIIGAGVASFSDYAFQDLYSLTTVHVEATTPPSIYYDTFSGTNLQHVIVPHSAVLAYVKDDYWREYIDHIEMAPEPTSVEGDMNHDGELSISDVTLLVNKVLHK